MEGACLVGLLLLDVSPSGYVHRYRSGSISGRQHSSPPSDGWPASTKHSFNQWSGIPERTLHERSRSELVREMKRLGSRRSPDGDGMSDRVIDVKMLNKLDCFLCQRDAAAFSCVVYGLIGAIATLVSSGRGSRAVSRATPFAWSIAASLVYSAAVTIAAALGSAGALHPWLSAWLPPLLGCSILLLVINIPVSSEPQQQLLNLAIRAKKLRANPTSS